MNLDPTNSKSKIVSISNDNKIIYDECLWTIENKYYTAKVTLHIFNADQTRKELIINENVSKYLAIAIVLNLNQSKVKHAYTSAHIKLV